MNFNNDKEMWDWQSEDYGLGDHTITGVDMPKFMMNGVNLNVGHPCYVFGDKTTPLKACGDLANRQTTNRELKGKKVEQYKEPNSQVKRRRMLQFESEVLPLCTDEMFLRSEETLGFLGDAVSDMPQWVPGFAEGTSDSGIEHLDPSCEKWIADCFNDTEMFLSTEDFSAGASDIQVDITELCNNPPEHFANQVEKPPVHTRRNVAFKGRKSYMRSPPKQATSIVYPFTFIKPCGVHGDVTLKDINQKIHTPPKPKQDEEDPSAYPTSAFSGKPVVGKTKIRTEGGEGSITIVRTKG